METHLRTVTETFSNDFHGYYYSRKLYRHIQRRDMCVTPPSQRFVVHPLQTAALLHTISSSVHANFSDGFPSHGRPTGEFISLVFIAQQPGRQAGRHWSSLWVSAEKVVFLHFTFHENNNRWSTKLLNNSREEVFALRPFQLRPACCPCPSFDPL